MKTALFSPAEYQRFFSLSLDLFCIAGTDGYFKTLNQSWEKLLGYTIEELKSRPFIDFVHPADQAQTLQTTRDSTSGAEVTSFENRYRRKDGAYRWISWASTTLSEDGLIYAVARDVTGRKKAELALQLAKAETDRAYRFERAARSAAERESDNLRLVLSQLPALAAILRGPELRFEFANPMYRTMIGGRDPAGERLRDAIPDLDSAIIDSLNRVYRTGERWIANEQTIAADWLAAGRKFEKVFNFTIEPICGTDGGIDGLWVLAIEVTEFKKMQDRLRISERMVSLGTVAAGVAHEINNPLGFALTQLSSLLERPDSLDPGTLHKLRDIEDGLLRIGETVRSLKTFSRTEPAQTRNVIRVDEAIRMAERFSSNEVRHRARLELDIGLLPSVYANRNELAQVFINLLINAAQSIPAGKVEDNLIRVTGETGVDGEAIVRISDTGQGVPHEQIDRLFEPFFTTKAGTGTGLGLSICHGIVSALGGSICVSSTLGRGSTFEVRIPGCVELSPPVPMVGKPQPRPERRGERLRILAVDDEKRLLEAISSVLSDEHDVVTCGSGKEALERLRCDRSFDLVLCDLMMPELTGLELHDQVKAWGGGLEDRFAFMSGGAFTEEAAEFLERVATRRLDKPFTAQHLRESVREWKKGMKS